MDMETATDMDIFIECTKKTILSWAILITESFRGELPEQLDLMMKSWLVGRRNVLRFMMAFLNNEESDEAIEIAVRTCSKYDKIMAKLVARNLHILANVAYEDLEGTTSEFVVLNEMQIDKIFCAEIKQTRDYYEQNGLFDILKQKVDGGPETFGMWIYNAEDAKQPLKIFNTTVLMPSDGLGLSFKRCVEYHYFFAQKVVELS